MTPIFQLKANSTDITETIKNHLVSLSVKDSLGLDSDTLTIVLDDKGQALAWPKKGVSLSLKLGFDNVLHEKGLFVVDELDHSGDPDELVIHCRAADLSQMSAFKYSKYWEATTLGAVCLAIANKYEYTASLDSEAKDIAIDAYQVDETDINFLARLSSLHSVLIQIKNGKLILSAVNRGGNDTNQAGFFIDDQSNPSIESIKRRNYYSYTLSILCNVLAYRYNLTKEIDTETAKIMIIEQQLTESDYDFFNRIAKKYKFHLEIKAGKLILESAKTAAQTTTQQSSSGIALQTVTIDRSEAVKPNYLERHTDEYSGCIARYVKQKCYSFFGSKEYCYGSEIKQIKRGSGVDIKDLGKFNDEAAAIAAADNFYQNVSGSTTFTLPLTAGRPDINVGVGVELTGDFLTRAKSQQWIVSEANHDLGDGLKTSITLVRSVEWATLKAAEASS